MIENAVVYGRTNESLEAVINGMRVRKGDKILAVCGSGDQAFAMTGKGAVVTAVDISPAQIKYVQQRNEALMNNSKEFFIKGGFAYDNAKKERINEEFLLRIGLKRIKNNLEGLKLVEGNVLDMQGVWDKIYLSNIHRCGYNLNFEDLSAKLDKNGLIYLSLLYDWSEMPEEGRFERYFAIDKELTNQSQRIETKLEPARWKPIVFRKIA